MADPEATLVAALIQRDLRAAEAALAAGADPGHVSAGRLRQVYHDEVPALALAAWTGDPRLVALLLDAGAAVNDTCTDYLCYAFSDDDVPFERKTALGVAAAEGHVEVAALLLARGADPNRQHPMCLAAAAGSLPIVEALLAAGGSPDQSDGDYHSPLYFAAVAGSVPILDRLRAAGGTFYRRIDLESARERAGSAAAKAWLAERADRALLQGQFSWWRADLPSSALDAGYAELVSALRGAPQAWGEALAEERAEDHPFGADWTDVHHRVTRHLGGTVVVRTETTRRTDRRPPPQSPRRIELAGAGLPTLSWAPDAVLIGGWGDEAELDRLDAALGACQPGFALEKLPDADSEYAARQALARSPRHPVG